MIQRRLIIVPILLVMVIILMEGSAVMAQDNAIQDFQDKLRQIEALPSGTVFSLSYTDTEVTNILQTLVTQYADQIQTLIKSNVGVTISLGDPSVTFRDGMVELTAKAGFSFIKMTAGITASLTLEDGAVTLHTQTVNVPVVTLNPSDVDGYLQPLLNQGMAQVGKTCTLRSISIDDGSFVIEAERK